MAGLLDELMGALGEGDGGLAGLTSGVLGDRAGTPEAEKATGLGLEAILGGLARNAETPEGAASLRTALERHEDGGALGDLGSFGSAERSADGGKILGHVFGQDQQALAQGIAGKSGLDVGSIMKLLPALAPVVMGMLGKKSNEGGLDASGLGSVLQGEAGGFDLGDLLGAVTGGGGGGILTKLLGGLFGGRR
ncbi:MAG: DUF937 domain-containing protein [Actinomycetota bacterium]